MKKEDWKLLKSIIELELSNIKSYRTALKNTQKSEYEKRLIELNQKLRFIIEKYKI
jgi:hypothetical protein